MTHSRIIQFSFKTVFKCQKRIKTETKTKIRQLRFARRAVQMNQVGGLDTTSMAPGRQPIRTTTLLRYNYESVSEWVSRIRLTSPSTYHKVISETSLSRQSLAPVMTTKPWAPARGEQGGQAPTLEKIRVGMAHPGNFSRGLNTSWQ